MKLDIGCGKKKEAGWIGIDLLAENNPDIVRDVCRGLPFSDNTVDEIRCSQVLEHIPTPTDLLFVLDEMWRVCKKNALITISVPRVDSIGAWSEPTHVRAMHERMFRSIAGSFLPNKFHIDDLHVDKWTDDSDTPGEHRANIVCVYRVAKINPNED